MHSICSEFESETRDQDNTLANVAVPRGIVAALHIGTERKGPMVSVPEVHAVAGAGLEGDRYCRQRGTFSKKQASNQITLIEAEALQAAARDYQIDITAQASRRNVLTCGIALNHLVGREFRIGTVRMRGLELCEPCTHLQKLTNQPVIKALRHRGGLRAEILNGGLIRVGDGITEAS